MSFITTMFPVAILDALPSDPFLFWLTIGLLLAGIPVALYVGHAKWSRRAGVDPRNAGTNAPSVIEHTLMETGAATTMRVWKILLRNIGWLIVLTTAINITMFAAPLHMLLVYDRVLTSGSVETLVMLTLICVVLLLSMSLLTAARQWLLIGKSEELDRELAPALLERDAAATPAALRDQRAATLSDLGSTRQMLTSPAASAVLDLPFAPLFFVGLFALHPYFGLLALAGAGVIIAVALSGELLAGGIARRASNASAASRVIASGLASGAPSAQAMGMSRRISSIWSGLHFSASAAQSQAGAQSAFVSSLVKFLRLALQSVTLALGAWLVLHKDASSGAIIASSIIMGRALAPLEILIGGWKPFLTSLKATGRVIANADKALGASRDDELRTRLPVPAGHLRVEGVSYRYNENSTSVISNVTLNVSPGQVLAIIGEGGSGKSTLARMMVGIEPPSAGRVTLDGVDLTSWPRAHVGPHLGYVAQDCEIVTGSVAENISRFELSVAGAQRDSVNRAVIEAASKCGAHEVFAAMAKAYDTPVGIDGCLLSSSQRKRIALARAIYGDVRLLVLDDPTSGLDATGERALASLIVQLKEQRVSVVLITHNAALVQLADQIVIMQSGSVVRAGTPAEIFNVPTIRPAPAHRPVMQSTPSEQAAAQSYMASNASARQSVGAAPVRSFTTGHPSHNITPQMPQRPVGAAQHNAVRTMPPMPTPAPTPIAEDPYTAVPAAPTAMAASQISPNSDHARADASDLVQSFRRRAARIINNSDQLGVRS